MGDNAETGQRAQNEGIIRELKKKKKQQVIYHNGKDIGLTGVQQQMLKPSAIGSGEGEPDF